VVHCTAIEIWDHGVFAAAGIERWSTEDDKEVIPEAIDLVAKLEQIASLKKLGLAIHFDVEIKEVLDLDNHNIHKEYESCSRRGYLHYCIML
jgi:hypothetical protein